jgi:rubrerythrin
MTLSTFGAIMGFAAELVKQAEDHYRALASDAKDSALKEVLEALSGEEVKTYALMMRARRENVTEMILEPVSGLHREDYEMDLKVPDHGEDAEIIRTALILEERGKKFFQDASAKVPLPEVARIFRRVAQKKEENLYRLQGLGLDKTFGKRA